MSTRATELQSYRGEWSPSTYYQYGDIIKNGGVLYICDVAHQSLNSFNSSEQKYFIAFDSSNANEGTLQKGLLKMLHHLPVIHTQRSLGDFPGDIEIKYAYDKVPNDSLLFVVPLKGSTSSNNRLAIKHPRLVTENGVTSVQYLEEDTKYYDIYIENHDGSKRRVGLGDIAPDRLCVFRFLSTNSNIVILCNNPIYNNLYCSTLTVTNQGMFYQRPVIIDSNSSSSTYNQPKDSLAFSSELLEVRDKTIALETRIQTGTQSAEDFFDAHPELPDGTIYLQMEE